MAILLHATNKVRAQSQVPLLPAEVLRDQKRRMTQLQQGALNFDYRYDPSDYRIGINAGIATRDCSPQGRWAIPLQVFSEDWAQSQDSSFRYAGCNRSFRVQRHAGGGQITDKYWRGVVVDEVINGYHYDWPNKETNLTFHHDHLNSVTAVTGHDGTTVETASYDPFGAMTSETGPAMSGGEVANKLRYTGREFDRETGLYYYRARYYDGERFLTEDPIGFRGGINKYAYVLNNPINANDPTGLIAITHTANEGDTVHVIIEIPIEYNGPGDKAIGESTVNPAIQDVWTGRFGKYNVMTVVTDTRDNFTNTVDLKHGKAFDSFVDNNRDGVWSTAQAYKQEEKVYGHEVGHFMYLKHNQDHSRIMSKGPGTTVLEEDIENIIKASKITNQHLQNREHLNSNPSKSNVDIKEQVYEK